MARSASSLSVADVLGLADRHSYGRLVRVGDMQLTRQAKNALAG